MSATEVRAGPGKGTTAVMNGRTVAPPRPAVKRTCRPGAKPRQTEPWDQRDRLLSMVLDLRLEVIEEHRASRRTRP